MALKEVRAALAQELQERLEIPTHASPPASIELPCIVIFPGRDGPGSQYWTTRPADDNRVTFCQSALYYQAWVMLPAHNEEHAWDELDDVLQTVFDLELCGGEIIDTTSPNQFTYSPDGKVGTHTLAMSITLEIPLS